MPIVLGLKYGFDVDSITLFLVELIQHSDLLADGVLDFSEEQTVGVGHVLVLHLASEDGLTHCLRLVAHGLRVGVVGLVLALGWQPLLLLAINIDQFVGSPEIDQLLSKIYVSNKFFKLIAIRLLTVTCPLVPLMTAVLDSFTLEEKRMRAVRPPL